MKFNKALFIVVFLISFLIGVTAFCLIPRSEKNIQQAKSLQIALPNFPLETIQMKSEPEVFEENDDWENEDESKFKVKLLETGEGFHGSEIKAKNGETWLGLFKQNNEYFLRSTKIKIRRVEDGLGDNVGEKTGKDVIADSETNPVFLVKNAKMLKVGKIKTVFYNSSDDNDWTTLANGFAQNFEINNNEYVLRVEGEANSSKLILEYENKKQILFSLDKMGDTTWNLIWVGDLDGDGKLDIYADLPTFYNFSEKRLFLSSQAENNKLIKQVAVFHISGC